MFTIALPCLTSGRPDEIFDALGGTMIEPNRPRLPKIILVALILLCWPFGAGAADTKTRTRDIPKAWDEAALADWVTPVAGLNVRPTHISEREYYSMPESILRSYPVYLPGSEPEGYWEMLQHIGPKPLIAPETLNTEAEWIGAGRLVFEEGSAPQMIAFDPRVISEFRSREFLEPRLKTIANGVIPGFRWVPTRKGVGLSRGGSCVGCHSLRRSDGLLIVGASSRSEVSLSRPFLAGGIRSDYLESANHLLR